MPLVETVTRPELRTPQEAAEAANLLRRLSRSTGKVRTGIGAGRQDVNVSVQGGTRIEIKGVYRIPLIPLLVYNEALRQYSLLKIRAELHRRGITEKTFESRSAEVTRLLGRTVWDPIRQALDRGEEVHCVNLKGYVGILSQPTQTGKVFSREISDRVRVIACLTRLPNILTSESTEETIDSFAGRRIRKAVHADSRDGLVLVWGNPADVRTAVQEIIMRAKEAIVGIPGETRQALADGTNGFERILPGPNRMYPDTDLPPLEITDERIARVRSLVPRPLWEREEKIHAMGLPDHLVLPIAASPKAGFFESLAAETGIPPMRIARLLFEKTKDWKRSGLPVGRLTDGVWRRFFTEASKNPLLLENAAFELEAFLKSEMEVWESFVPARLDEKEAARVVARIIEEKPASPDPEARVRFFMGRAMETLRGKIAGETVCRMVKERLED
jgi:glutamyl-tRNA(Gln) amidotransferase subunit E